MNFELVKRFFIVIACSVLFLSSCERTGREVIFNGEWVTHEGTGYELVYPDNWQVTTANYTGVDAILMSPKEYRSDPFLENFNVVEQTVENYELQEYTKLSAEQISGMFNDAKMISQTDNEINGNKCITMIYTAQPGAIQLKYRQDYYLVDNTAFVVTFTAEKDRFDDYAEISEKVFQSFKIH